MSLFDNLPSITAKFERNKTITLGDLRHLVQYAENLSDDHIVRGSIAVPFRDFGNRKGSRIMALAIDLPDDDGPEAA